MSLSADHKITMSLEDLIKARKDAQPKKKATTTTRKKATTSAKPTPAAAGRNRRRRGGDATAATKKKNAGLGAKATKVVATAAAKRAAVVANRRGLSNTSRASKKQVKKAVTKAEVKALKSTGAGRRGRAGRAGTRVPPTVASSMKISFKPTELKQTTEKNVSKQINAVLSKQSAGRGGGAAGKGNSGGQSLFSSTSAPGQKQKKTNPGANRGGPRARSASGNLRVKR